MEIEWDYELHVAGVPGPKGSKSPKGTFPNGRARLVEQSKKVKPWEKAIIAAGLAQGVVRVPPPYAFQIIFYMPKAEKPKYWYPVQGDLDKFIRATLDPMQILGVIEDDKHCLLDIGTRKVYAETEGVTGAVIRIKSITKEELYEL